MNNSQSWDRVATKYLAGSGMPSGIVSYGADLADETELRLCGNVKGRRTLELGSGGANNSLAFAAHGAYAVAVDACAQMLAHGRTLAEARELRVEWHRDDIADLAWLRADSIDLALSVGVLAEIEDLDRLFRQVHRVLKTGAPFVFTYDHPMALCCSRDLGGVGELPLGRLEVRRSYFELAPLGVVRFDEPFTLFPRTVSDLFGALGRAGFAIDALHELELLHTADPGPRLPVELAIRARKLGS